MKKIILLIAVSISICMTSCNSDDDGAAPVNTAPVEGQDKFIGSWKVTKEFKNGVETALDICDLMDVLTVTADQKLTYASHIMENGTCKLDITITGTWENLGNDIYKITLDQGENGLNRPKVTFSGNTMTIEATDEDGVFKQILTRI